VFLGKIVKSASHVRYQARIYDRRSVDCAPGPGDYALGSFVRMALRATKADLVPLLRVSAGAAARWASPTAYVVGVICDTVLLTQGPDRTSAHLSNEMQREIFSPDFVEDQAVLVWIQLVGMMVVQQGQAVPAESGILYGTHGVPLLAAEPESEVERMAEVEIRSFHLQRDRSTGAVSGGMVPYLGYYDQLATPVNSLMPQVRLLILEHLERLFPDHTPRLRLLKHLGGWQRLAGAIG